MKLYYEIETESEINEIEAIHNYLDMVFMKENLTIKKSTLRSGENPAEITIHDGEKKCRICGCDWFHACPGGCYWVEEDLCSSCADKLEENSECNNKECRSAEVEKVVRLKLEKNVHMEIHITGEIIKDYADCQKYTEIKGGAGKDCKTCSLNMDIFGNALCELQAVINEIIAFEE